MRSPPTRGPGNLGPFATLVVPPFIEGSVFGVSRLRLFAVATLLAGVYAVSRRRRVFWPGVAIALAALGTEGSVHTKPARALAAAEAVTGSLYLAIFIARLVGLHMAHAKRSPDP